MLTAKGWQHSVSQSVCVCVSEEDPECALLQASEHPQPALRVPATHQRPVGAYSGL